MNNILGYYPVIGDSIMENAICDVCVNHRGHGSSCTCCGQWDIDQAELIFSWSESDTPTWCCVCDSLIEHNLTGYGLEYAADIVAAPGAASVYRKALKRAYFAD